MSLIDKTTGSWQRGMNVALGTKRQGEAKPITHSGANKNGLSDKKRTRRVPLPPNDIANKRPRNTINYTHIANSALARIRTSKNCRDAYETARRLNLPEIFINTKERWRQVPNIGRDVISGCRRDESLAEFGQAPEGPSSWGRVFIVLPWLQKVEVLNKFSTIKANAPAMWLLSDAVEIDALGDEQELSFASTYTAPARLDLIFRFGLLGCRKDNSIADTMKKLIPLDKRGDVYSFALQNAVMYNDVNIMKYCFDNQATPLSPPNPFHDYREDSPIELAFSSGTKAVQNLMLEHVKMPTDLPAIKDLFMDKERWISPPSEIASLIQNYI